MDRPLCSALTSGDATSCQGSTYATFFYDGYSNTSTPGATFPTGCVAPGGNYASNPIGRKTAELFSGASGAGSGWRCYGYDQRGQSDQSTLSVTTAGGQTLTQTVNMTYNDGGEVTGLVYPDGETLTSNYDVNGRLRSAYFGASSTPDPVSFLVGQVTYANDGQLAGLVVGGSGAKNSIPTAVFTTSTKYDSIQRPLSNSVTEAGQTLWSQTRTYDSVGNVLGLSTTVPTQSGVSATENETFCYDALNRLAWAGNSGTPSGGDYCMAAPSGTTLTAYAQSYSYDNLDRITSSGTAGTYTYGDANHAHAVTRVSSVPNAYASYDAMGNMLCRNADATHTCSGGSPTGAQMGYDGEGRLVSWSAPSGTVGTAHYLYDNEGNRVYTNATNGSTTTDTIYFDGYTDTVIAGGTTTTTKYYSASGQRVAVRVGGSTLDYLVSDPLGSNTIALNNVGRVIALQHYSPYGTVDYTWGTMPTTYSYATQRLDSQTGLLYDNFRYYDPVTGRYVRSDNVQDNANGMDPYAYVGDNPETRNDPSGHCWPLCTAIIGAVIGASVGAVVGAIGEYSKHGTDFGHYNWGHVVVNAGVGAVAGAMVGTGVGAAVVIGMATGGATSAIVAVASHQSFADGLQSVFEGAAIGGIMGGLTAGAGEELGLGGRELFNKGTQGIGLALKQGALQAVGGMLGNVGGQIWDSWRSGDPNPQFNVGSMFEAGMLSFGTGFLGQYAYNHWPVFRTGATYTSRQQRWTQRNYNWSMQSNWGNGISGFAQGGVQLFQSSLNSDMNSGIQSSWDTPRVRGPY